MFAANISMSAANIPACLPANIPACLPLIHQHVSRQYQQAEVLEADRSITDVYTIHSETTTGVVNDVAAIGAAVQAARVGGGGGNGGAVRDICFTVDAMSSFGAYDCNLPELGVDFMVTSARDT
jgi:aspartate aminotransferase-like enzyme